MPFILQAESPMLGFDRYQSVFDGGILSMEAAILQSFTNDFYCRPVLKCQKSNYVHNSDASGLNSYSSCLLHLTRSAGVRSPPTGKRRKFHDPERLQLLLQLQGEL